MEKLIFNSSMPRSGSELLQVILHQNPRIYASATSPLLEYQFAARGNYQLPEVKSQDPQLMQQAFVSMCNGMAQGYYDAITDRPVVCDKNRGWSHYFEWVEQWCEKPKMLCMVRDLRSIIASMEKAYRKSRHTPAGPDNPTALQSMTVGARAEHWLSTQPVGLPLQRTADLFQRGVADKVLFVRYEDLCDSPAETMQKVYEYLEEEPCTHDFDNLTKEVVEDCTLFGPYGDHNVKPQVTPPKRNDWNEVLPQAVSNAVKDTQAWYFETFGY